jgi:hypothetical protein
LVVAAKVWHRRGVLFDPPAVDKACAALGLRLVVDLRGALRQRASRGAYR